MEIRYKVIGSRRKEMAYKIAELSGFECRYLFLPTYAFEIGDFYLAKDGTLTIDTNADENIVAAVLEGLEESGFEMEDDFLKLRNKPKAGLTVTLPANFFDERIYANLSRLIENKSTLLKHAFKTENLDYYVNGEEVEFPWFNPEESADDSAYCEFISALFDMAKSQNRINNKPDKSDNEKYAFRCFLIRLGFVGKEYKHTRKVLLRNLEGSSAFRHGGVSNEKSE